jgi:hypothetical protein
VNLHFPYIDRIWRARGELPLDEALSPDEAFARIELLLQAPGTDYAVDGDTLAYSKRNPAAQDKLATFTSGTLRISQQDNGRSLLSFNVSSAALLLVFLAPLLFLGFAQAMVTINGWEQANTEAAQPDKKKEEKPKVKAELHPLDKLLGAPEPEDPAKKKEKDKGKKKEKFSPTRAYVLAGLFFVIYLVGRVLEPWLLKRTLRAALARRPDESAVADGEEMVALGANFTQGDAR